MRSVPTMTEKPRPVRIAAWIEGLQNKRSRQMKRSRLFAAATAFTYTRALPSRNSW